MADNAFQFPSAPSSGVGRQFGAVAGVVSALKGSKGGLSARAQSGLMAQQHAHNMELESHRATVQNHANTLGAVVGHVLGESAADAAHKRTLQANRQANKHATNMQKEKFAGENARAANDYSRASMMSAQTHRQDLAMGKEKHAQQTTLNGQAIKAISQFPNISSINTSSGSVNTRES